ncbi:hypothetical protein E2C01_046352 [Portunus trituberculatus]|uniref:Uncharacterized protein n=1 Tax=Portunus trituberculatus TaxID=210409 RepID=A0A5B7G0Q5_PORTR|nr:hypothetical protein [Portunus trituberculatus]
MYKNIVIRTTHSKLARSLKASQPVSQSISQPANQPVNQLTLAHLALPHQSITTPCLQGAWSISGSTSLREEQMGPPSHLLYRERSVRTMEGRYREPSGYKICSSVATFIRMR